MVLKQEKIVEHKPKRGDSSARLLNQKNNSVNIHHMGRSEPKFRNIPNSLTNQPRANIRTTIP
jgi:ribosomal protein S24E